MPSIVGRFVGQDAIAQHGIPGLTSPGDDAGNYTAEAFGFGWHGPFPMPAFHAGEPASWAQRGLTPLPVCQIATPAEREVLLSLKTKRLRQICRDGARVAWGNEVLLDLVAGDDGLRITCCLGPGWRGTLPTGFYATVAALACAWRGDIALHCSAVSWRGTAILLGGPAGAGKSTSLAAMLLAGAQLIGDDLSVVAAGASATGGQWLVRRGRPHVRLHPATLPLIPLAEPAWQAPDDSGKWLARPQAMATQDAVPLGAVLLLGHDGEGRIAPVDAAMRASTLFFRPVLQGAMPTARSAARDLLRLANSVPFAATASPTDFSAAGLLAHGRALLALADSLVSGHAAAPPQ